MENSIFAFPTADSQLQIPDRRWKALCATRGWLNPRMGPADCGFSIAQVWAPALFKGPLCTDPPACARVGVCAHLVKAEEV